MFSRKNKIMVLSKVKNVTSNICPREITIDAGGYANHRLMI